MAIDAEITEARETNRQRTLARQQQRDAQRAKEQREALSGQAKAKHRAAERITERLEQIVTEKAQQLADAKLPIPGLAIAGDVVTLAIDGKPGVDVSALDNYPRMLLDVQMGAAQGHKLLVVRDAILLTQANRANLERAAAALGVQLVAEVVIEGQETLTAEIIDGEQ